MRLWCSQYRVQTKGRFTQDAGVGRYMKAGIEKSLSIISVVPLYVARVRCAYDVSGYEAGIYE